MSAASVDVRLKRWKEDVFVSKDLRDGMGDRSELTCGPQRDLRGKIH